MAHVTAPTARRFKVLAALTLLLALLPVAAFATHSGRFAYTSFPTAGQEADLGFLDTRDYMTVTLNASNVRSRFVKVEFTGYAFARSTTDGCPCLIRLELRKDNETKRVVTRTILGVDANDLVGDADTPAAERRSVSGSFVFLASPGAHTYTMSVSRDVGTSPKIGFAFGNMQAAQFNRE